jgi:hypothetical protein
VLSDGRAGFDVKALGASPGAERGQDTKTRVSTAVEKLEARALLIDGVAFADSVSARAGGKEVAAFGRVGLADGYMEVRVVVTDAQPAPPDSRPAAPQSLTVRGPWHAPVIRVEEVER